ncbi:MAG: hypothetical protein B6244_07055 [Candidatus Cloacimonetes bacterium 4572_55]|nr:MAG: hypothetical protein B6244_07055 [Candidatus Cloacimonetes bacterium 4572_55]
MAPSSVTDKSDIRRAAFVHVKFKDNRSAFFINSDNIHYEQDTYVIVESTTGFKVGQTIGHIVADVFCRSGCMKKVVRAADEKEIEEHLDLVARRVSAIEICTEEIKKLKLKMKLIDMEFQSDESKLTFYFTASRRVDFRELVRVLAGIFKIRIELRQVGVRDEAKLLDGVGPCGNRLCCSCFLKDFAPITLKMARDQQISLTPSKISGVCGRLLCCLEYEHKMYKERAAIFPPIGSKIQTKDGSEFTVIKLDIFKDIVIAKDQNGTDVPIILSDIKMSSKSKKIKTANSPKSV